MKIFITDEAKEYIKARDGEVIVSTVVAKGCCGAEIREPVTSTKLPKEIENYRRFDEQGITIYLPPNLELEESGLKIKLSGFWKWKYLTASGIKCLF